ncbi:MAG: hypothetical protein CMG09_01950 [Candidatus Marinimicrobia bacterium]|nr:hypothetical protein [Candidatus Neomarinimicrobiota bacterium]|tara:strand:- start:592 stop:1359 length:768 start_codon:yes stop_codon:yes gene_type:complete
MKLNFLIIKTIYNQILSTFENNSRGAISLISGFLIIFSARMFFTATDTIFIADEYPAQRIIFMLSTALLLIGFEIGYTKFIFQIIDKKKSTLKTIFNNFNLLNQYIIGQLYYCFIIVIVCLPVAIYMFIKYDNEIFDIIYNSILDPYFQELINSYVNLQELLLIFILLSIPIIYIAIRLTFWSYFIIDKNYSGANSLKASWELTKNKNFEIIFVGIFLIAFNLLGIISIIGICFTAPLSYLFYCLYFRYLVSNKS